MEQLGKYFIFLGKMFRRRESFKVYWRLLMDECILIGIDSVYIVALVSSFIGAVTTVQTAYKFSIPYLPLALIGNIVRDMTLLELAPTITAIVFAGKVGSSISGGLGTMRITEQIDAIEVMGINSVSYLVLPKVLAGVLMYPMLVVLAGFLSILGGFLAGTLTGALSAEDYIYGIRWDFVPFNATFALIKSFVFGFLVTSISAFEGFYTRGGALEVGRASTTAVTKSCIGILIADYLLAQLLL
ncbi:MAG: MlaE family ABC transporter permease [Bernardetiaceae bacterium]